MTTARQSSSQWRKRLDMIESIDFETIAEQVNAQRLKRIRRELEEPGGRRRRKRLARLADEGNLEELPKDLAANPKRIRRTLAGLHNVLGPFPDGIKSAEAIAEKIGESHQNTRRGLIDLEEASLVWIERNERTGRYGGQGWSKYRIIWATITDIADEQGLDGRLFAPELDETEAAEDGGSSCPGIARRERAATTADQGEAAASNSEQPPTQIEQPPTQIEQPPTQIEQPPTQIEQAQYNARTRAPFSPSLQDPPSPSQAPATAPTRGGGGNFGNWGPLCERLKLYGLAAVSKAVSAAKRSGWSIEQVDELIGHCERHTIGTVQAWGPGLVYRILTTCPAGTKIEAPASETYRRVQRDREIEIERRSWAAQIARENEERQRAEQAARNRELALGATLDGLDEDEVDQLAEDAMKDRNGPPFLSWQRRGQGRHDETVRRLLLIEIEQRIATEHRKQITAGHDAPSTRATGPVKEGPTPSIGIPGRS